MRQLAPPISVISDLMNPPQSADLSRAQIAESVPEQGYTVPDEEVPSDLDVPVVPPMVTYMIAARVATAALKLSTAPRSGLILQFGVVGRGADKGPEWELPPCAVVLSEPTHDPKVWNGFLMAAETDYATDWDILLLEDDEPHDPTVQMIQAWNRVKVYCPAATMALGLLKPPRLAALRALVSDIQQEKHAPVEPQPGELVLRPIGGDHLILTGTPLLKVGKNDPRRQYQEAIYAPVAARLTKLAKKMQSPSWWQAALVALQKEAERWLVSLTPVPVLAMGPETGATPDPDSRPETMRLGELLDLQFIPGSERNSVQIHATLLPGPASVSLTLLEPDGLVAQQLRLDAQHASGDLWAEGGLTLSVRDEHGKGLFEARLPVALSAER